MTSSMSRLLDSFPLPSFDIDNIQLYSSLTFWCALGSAPQSLRPTRAPASDCKFTNTHGTSQLQTGYYGLLLCFLIHLWMIVVQSKLVIYI